MEGLIFLLLFGCPTPEADEGPNGHHIMGVVSVCGEGALIWTHLPAQYTTFTLVIALHFLIVLSEKVTERSKVFSGLILIMGTWQRSPTVLQY